MWTGFFVLDEKLDFECRFCVIDLISTIIKIITFDVMKQGRSAIMRGKKIELYVIILEHTARNTGVRK